MGIERWHLPFDYGGPEMERHPDGSYVRYSDYATLEAEAAELREKVAADEAEWRESLQKEYERAEHHKSAREADEAALKEAVRHLANALEIARRNEAGAVLDEAAAWLSQHSGASNAEPTDSKERE